MIYIMIVDDEPISADGVTSYLESAGEPDWQIHTCYSPREVLQSLNSRIDVLIADVLMPDMNGVELARKVAQRWPMTKVIFLTASPGIERAQDAVRMPESVDYLLKDDDLDALLASVRRAVQQIEREQTALTTRKELEQQVLEALPMLQSAWMTQVLRGKTLPSGGLQSQLTRLRLPLTADPVLMLVARYDLPDREKDNGIQAEMDLGFFTLDNLMQRYTGGMLSRYAVSPEPQQTVWLFQPRENAVDAEHQDSTSFLFAALDIVQESFARGGGMVSFVLDDGFHPWNQLPARYKLLHRRSSFDGPDALVRQSAQSSDAESWINLSEKELVSLLDQGLAEEAAQRIRHLADQPPYTVSGRLELCRFLLKALSNYLSAQEGTADRLGDTPLPAMHLTGRKWSVTLNGWAELFLRLGYTPQANQDRRLEKFVRQVQDIVRDDIAGDLSLITVADRVCMSPSYFSRQFKKAAGVGFAEYVMAQRIELGEKLLRETGLTLNAITARIGYYSVSHFISSFQRFYHMTPGEYRQHIRQSGQKTATPQG